MFGGDLGHLATPWERCPGVSIHTSQPWLPHARCWAHLHAQAKVPLCRGSHCCPGPPRPPLSALPPEGPRRSRHPAQVQRGRLSAAVLAVVCADPCPDPGDRGLSPAPKPTPPTLQGWSQRAAALGASLRPGPGPQVQVAEQDPAGAQLLRHGLLGLQGRPRAHHRGQVSRRPRLPQHPRCGGVRGCGGEEARQGLIAGWLSAGRHPGTPSWRVSGSVLDAAQVAGHPGAPCCGPGSPSCAPGREVVLVLSPSLGCVCWALTPLPRRPPRRTSHELLSPCGRPTLVPTRRPPHRNNRAPSRRLAYALCTWFLLSFFKSWAYPLCRVWEGCSRFHVALSPPFPGP